jgi:hypothetical protein
MEAQENLVAENLSDRREHGLPGTKRELDDHIQVALSELTDFDCARFHNQQRVDVPSVPPPGPVLGNVTERAMIPA